MGSKRKLAVHIVKFIIQRHGGVTDFYDLFGGGGSVSFTALEYGANFNVHYNELNRHIYSLVKYIKENKTLEAKFYEWVTREEFFEQVGKSNEDADWYSGFVMSCWSFRNSQNSYLYGKEIEEFKRLAHEVIVNLCLDSSVKLGLDIPNILSIPDLQTRRIAFCNHIKKLTDKRCDVQNLELVEHLARMQNLQNLQNLQCTNLSYEQVKITGKNPVIYCDIPYKGTGEYKEGGFDHYAFYKWAKSIDCPVYISEYDAPFKQVMSFEHRSSMSATNNKKKTLEKIFWNEKGFVTNLF